MLYDLSYESCSMAYQLPGTYTFVGWFDALQLLCNHKHIALSQRYSHD